jgi:Tat protein secretion system quality control protein TatD with DNase activity
MVPYIAQEIATLKNEPLEKLFLQCRANTQKMYGI